MNRVLNSGIEDVDIMAGVEFEYFLSVHFKNLGYKVQTALMTSDYGADLIVTWDN